MILSRYRHKLGIKFYVAVCCILLIVYVYNNPKRHNVLTPISSEIHKVPESKPFPSEEIKEPDNNIFAPVVVDETHAFTDRKQQQVHDSRESEIPTTNKISKDKGEIEEIKTEKSKIVQPKKYDSPWTYICENELCRRKMITKDDKSSAVSVNRCWLTCGEYGSLWPIPSQSVTLNGENTVPFQYSKLQFSIVNEHSGKLKTYLDNCINLTSNIFLEMLPSELQLTTKSGENYMENIVKVSVTVTSQEENHIFILESTNETYTLEVYSEKNEKGITIVNVKIVSDSYYGVRHGLETLTQLVSYDEINRCYQIVGKALINDGPSFKYRGVFIDTASNFISIPILKRIVDAMSFNKLNVLRWHFADKDSFSIFNPSSPEMSICGAYSKKKMYNWADISDFVDYARIRGVKILPVLDNNYLRYLDDLTINNTHNCLVKRKKSDISKKSYYTMDPFQPNTMQILGEFYKNWFKTFDNDIFHLGSTSIDENCLQLQKKHKSGNHVEDWMKKENITEYSGLWASFLNKIVDTLKEANDGKLVKVILLDKDLTLSDLLLLNSSNFIIQTTAKVNSARVSTFLNQGFQLIPAETFLDTGFTRDDSLKYSLWQNIYDYPIQNTKNSQQMLGSEVAVWTTNANEGSIEVKLWPRACALAERLWSNVKSRDDSAFSRLNNQNLRMMKRGIPTEMLQPESCYLLSGHCDDEAGRI